MILPSVLMFDDYRRFLAKFYKYSKLTRIGYSYRLFSKEAGIDSPNYLKLVIDGTRNLTVQGIHQFANGLNLSGLELDYFETLVLENQSSTDFERRYYRRRRLSMKQALPQKNLALRFDKNYVQHPLFPAMLLSLMNTAVTDAEQKLTKSLKLSKQIFQEAISAFLKEGLIEIVEDHYRLNGDHIVLHTPSPSKSQKTFLGKQLDISRQAFEATYDHPSKFFSHTFTVPAEDFAACSEDVLKFIRELTFKYDVKSSEMITQLNIQLFPLDPRVLTNS